jgi:hypothetical protein
MGIDLKKLQEIAQNFKENVWYYLDCNRLKCKRPDAEVRDAVNSLLDYIDSLED